MPTSHFKTSEIQIMNDDNFLGAYRYDTMKRALTRRTRVGDFIKTVIPLFSKI